MWTNSDFSRTMVRKQVTTRTGLEKKKLSMSPASAAASQTARKRMRITIRAMRTDR